MRHRSHSHPRLSREASCQLFLRTLTPSLPSGCSLCPTLPSPPTAHLAGEAQGLLCEAFLLYLPVGFRAPHPAPAQSHLPADASGHMALHCTGHPGARSQWAPQPGGQPPSPVEL